MLIGAFSDMILSHASLEKVTHDELDLVPLPAQCQGITNAIRAKKEELKKKQDKIVKKKPCGRKEKKMKKNKKIDKKKSVQVE